MSDITLRQELVQMKIKEQKNIEELKEKYNYILLEKKNTIYELEHKFEKIDEVYKYEFKKTNSEMTKIYGMLISLISYIENNKKDLLIENNSDELKKIIFSIKNDIKNENYPFLFKELDKQKKKKEKKEKKEKNEDSKDDQNSTKSEKNKEKDEEIKIVKNNEYENLTRDEVIEKLKNKIKRLMLSYDIQLKKYNNNVFLMGLQQRTIDKLKREINLYKKTLKNKKIPLPIIPLNNNTIDTESNKNSKNKNKNLIEKDIKNKVIQKSFSFNSEKEKFDMHLLNFNNKYKEKDLFNFDSYRQPSTSNTNFNSLFRPSSPDSSYTNTNNFNTSLLNKNKVNNTKPVLLMQKKMVNNEHKNRRPFSAIRQRENSQFDRKISKSKL